MLERVIDEAARVTGIDPVKLRRRNLIKPKAMPYKTAVGTTDRQRRVRDRARQGADARRLRRLQAAPARGRQSAASIAASASPACWSMPAAFRSKAPRSAFPAARRCSSASTCSRPARATPPYSIRMLAERLGIRPEQVEHRHGDSAMEIAGYASVGSRSAMTVSHALIKTVEALLAKGKAIAASVLETAESRHRVWRRPFQRGRHRPRNLAVRPRGAGQGDEAARRNRRRPRHQDQCRDAAHLSQRLSHRRGGDRSRRPGRWRSSPMPRSTIAAARSTP